MIEILDEAAARADTSAESVLAEYSWLGAAIDHDAAAGHFKRWGISTVVDEHVGGPVLSPTVFAALHARAGVDAQWPVGIAGVLHVYGYLLSRTPTPYGLKRDRWLGGKLARAYGLDAQAFVPWVSTHTLLDRVTEAATTLLARETRRVAVVSGVETSVALGCRSVGGPWALAYSVGGLLVTTFCVDSADAILAEWDARPDRPRWNAVV